MCVCVFRVLQGSLKALNQSISRQISNMMRDPHKLLQVRIEYTTCREHAYVTLLSFSCTSVKQHTTRSIMRACVCAQLCACICVFVDVSYAQRSRVLRSMVRRLGEVNKSVDADSSTDDEEGSEGGHGGGLQGANGLQNGHASKTR